jgi:hypothetical protein
MCPQKILDQKRAIKDKLLAHSTIMKTKLAEAPNTYQKKSYGTFARSSSIHTRAFPSEGARQSPRGDNEPPDEIFGPFGRGTKRAPASFQPLVIREKIGHFQCFEIVKYKFQR